MDPPAPRERLPPPWPSPLVLLPLLLLLLPPLERDDAEDLDLLPALLLPLDREDAPVDREEEEEDRDEPGEPPARASDALASPPSLGSAPSPATPRAPSPDLDAPATAPPMPPAAPSSSSPSRTRMRLRRRPRSDPVADAPEECTLPSLIVTLGELPRDAEEAEERDLDEEEADDGEWEWEWEEREEPPTDDPVPREDAEDALEEREVDRDEEPSKTASVARSSPDATESLWACLPRGWARSVARRPPRVDPDAGTGDDADMPDDMATSSEPREGREGSIG
jgi:hypothetical protein